MDAQLDDIRENTTAKRLEELRSCILDCTKNIKSNDASFGISTFPSVKDEVEGTLADYHDIKKNMDASRTVFLKIYEKIEGDEESDDYVNLESISKEFQKNINKELKKLSAEPEEEIIVENRQIPKDPITRQNIKVAVKSKVCNHIYDKEAIHNYFQQRKNKTVKCPQAGCTNKNMKIEDLVDDEETNELIQSL